MGDRQEKEIPVDCRLIMAVNKDLDEAVRQEQIREDIYFRLKAGAVIKLPPLRERIADIRHLAKYFIHKHQENNPSIHGITEDGIALLEDYRWPGNAAELESTIERAGFFKTGEKI